MKPGRWMIGGAIFVILLIAVGVKLVLFSDLTVWGRVNIYNELQAVRDRAVRNPEDPRPIEALVAAMQSGSSHRRSNAARFLGTLGPRAAPAIQPLIAAAGDSDGYVSQEGVRALAEIGPAASAAVPTLMKLMKEQPTASPGLSAITALGRVADPSDASVIDALKEFERNADWLVRYESNVALRTLEYRRANPASKKIPNIFPSEDFK